VKYLREVLKNLSDKERDKHLKEIARRLRLIAPLSHEEYCILEAILIGRENPISEAIE